MDVNVVLDRVVFASASEVMLAWRDGLITRGEARTILGLGIDDTDDADQDTS